MIIAFTRVLYILAAEILSFLGNVTAATRVLAYSDEELGKLRFATAVCARITSFFFTIEIRCCSVSCVIPSLLVYIYIYIYQLMYNPIKLIVLDRAAHRSRQPAAIIGTQNGTT